ncbi:MAG: T9SS type A sorting domain-containing protein [Crocinitomix sp.]|nr:T9SS type A sorting domain-containing protein [Crocinitomix sp.]
MRVNIPNPCSENWAEMSTTQRGAFCQKCAVDVIDFSKKNAQEVKETLKANIGKHMCGRFSTTQLTDLSHAYQVWENQSARTFQSKFLWACMIAFGLTLFTGCENSIAQDHAINSFNSHQINLAIDDSTKTDSTITTSYIDRTINGQVEYTDFVKGDIDISEPELEIKILGEFVSENDEIDEVIEPMVCDTITEDSTVKTPPSPLVIQPDKVRHVMGKIAPPPRFNDYLADTVKVETIPESIETATINALVYPNPTTGVAKLKVNVTEAEYYTIELYSFQGEKINTIFTGVIENNQRTFEIDLSNYPSGTYLVKITSNYVAHVLKIIKVN